jgi:hypothetical protein
MGGESTGDVVPTGGAEVVPSQAPATPPPASSPPAAQQPQQSYPPNLIPENPAFTKQTYASPMSYIGSGRRTTAWIRKFGTTPAKAFFGWTFGVIWVATMWLIILPAWYFVTLVLFGVFMIPYRLVRRSHRKQEHMQRTQLATMQAMLVQQQQALINNQQQNQQLR